MFYSYQLLCKRFYLLMLFVAIFDNVYEKGLGADFTTFVSICHVPACTSRIVIGGSERSVSPLISLFIMRL